MEIKIHFRVTVTRKEDEAYHMSWADGEALSVSIEADHSTQLEWVEGKAS